MRTLKDIVQIVKDKIPEKTQSGKLYIPEMVRTEVDQNTERGIFTGTVTCVGPDVQTIKVGDHVMFLKGTYELYDTDEGKRCGMHASDVMAVIEPGVDVSHLSLQ